MERVGGKLRRIEKFHQLKHADCDIVLIKAKGKGGPWGAKGKVRRKKIKTVKWKEGKKHKEGAPRISVQNDRIKGKRTKKSYAIPKMGEKKGSREDKVEGEGGKEKKCSFH